jgi:23S rRNA (cytidine1920-2'-O)/16S rRNA (cytidine1409-2'-O)-methyltransferase
MDLSFISLTKVLPAVRGLLRQSGRVLALLKPQFEGERAEVSRGGIVRDPAVHARIIGRFVHRASRDRWRVLGPVSSPIMGQTGNREFFLLLRPYPEDATDAA